MFTCKHGGVFGSKHTADTDLKNGKQNRKKAFLAYLLVLFISIWAVIPAAAPAFAAEDETGNDGKTVRVGWYDSQFFETGRDGRLSGYAYEYQLDVAAYTGWKYEYVEGSWPELLQMLKEGKIDLLTDVSYTAARAEQILYSSSPMGEERYFIYVSENNKKVSAANLKWLNGKTTAVNKGSVQKELLENWISENGLSPEIVEVTGDESEIIDQLNEGKYDALVGVEQKAVPLVQIGASEFYFGINKERPDLKADLDGAMAALFSSQENYNDYLTDKYLTDEQAYTYLPADEIRWLSDHPTIRVGYRSDYMAVCGQDPETGELTGGLSDYLKMMRTCFENATLEFEAVAYDDPASLLKALRDGDVDCIFPVNRGPYEAEQENILVTNGTMSAEMYAIVKKEETSDFSINDKLKVAVNKHGSNYISFIRDNFPQWELVEVETDESRADSVASGEADCYLTTNYRTNAINDGHESMGLVSVPTGKTFESSFAVRRDNLTLYAILNRATSVISDDKVNAALTKYALESKNESLGDFLQKHVISFITIVGLIMAIILALLLRTVLTMRRTNRLNAELAIARDEAESANRAKSTFLFNMSHDIRTPMNAIIGFTNMAIRRNREYSEEDGVKTVTKDMDECLTKISVSSDYLLQVLNGVLEMARIENNRVNIVNELTDCEELFNECGMLVEDEVENKKLNMDMKMDVEHRFLYVDRTHVKEIYMNIISNAVKYTAEGGSINVSLRELPGDSADTCLIETSIEDTGIGMSAEFLEHAFESFERERSPSTESVKGTGLGLAIVKRLTDLLGGTISLESELGKGTKVTFTLPHQIGCEEDLVHEKEEKNRADHSDFEGKHILLAEDNDLNAEIAEDILSDANFRVTHVWDGAECIEAVKASEAGTYDLILMDIQMPNIDGYKATRYIRSMTDTAKAGIPIIAMTANAFREDIDKAISFGMDDHIAKPVEVSKLMEALTRVLK